MNDPLEIKWMMVTDVILEKLVYNSLNHSVQICFRGGFLLTEQVWQGLPLIPGPFHETQ